ncbi:3-keto-5-aminohexanoate cleavage protein, partial [Streptomyces lydicus]|uniref:3-keto-5-aminohexanoate cleavage protein n=1 Tax=Streptomyces lydicus TaxID=47763 RepID=UPI0037FACF89
MLQVCLNGPRTAADSGAVPMSPAALAEAARQAVAAGATDIHVHPKTPCGRDQGLSFGSGRIRERGLVPCIARRRRESGRSPGD